ncbi:uncharacterized protein A4U43_C05F10700 [Asparagus officinalis]|uniref:Uncharacterized protein n=1 Tax=Asparagus officinalis TaxID=4686 RepID=A0A5P1EQT5_ASPOF|nr:uncharacterized protein A4U43_C05F10700 [Asparagus officinalis]
MASSWQAAPSTPHPPSLSISYLQRLLNHLSASSIDHVNSQLLPRLLSELLHPPILDRVLDTLNGFRPPRGASDGGEVGDQDEERGSATTVVVVDVVDPFGDDGDLISVSGLYEGLGFVVEASDVDLDVGDAISTYANRHARRDDAALMPSSTMVSSSRPPPPLRLLRLRPQVPHQP